MTNEGSDPFTIFLFSTAAAEQIRDYCYVSDMADAFVLVAERGEGVYNAAGGSPTSIKHHAELMVSIISPEAEIRYGGRTWAGDVNTLYADITRIKDLGFEPKVGFDRKQNLLL